MTPKIVIVEAIDGKYRDQPPFVHHIKTNFLLHPNVLKPVDLQVSEYDRGPYSWWLEWIIQQTIYNYNTCSMLCINSRFNISLTIILKTERGKAVRKRTYKRCYWDCTLYLMLSYSLDINLHQTSNRSLTVGQVSILAVRQRNISLYLFVCP